MRISDWSSDVCSFELTERKYAESKQAALYAISEAALAAEDLPALVHHIHQIVGTLLPVNNFSVVLYEEETDQLKLSYNVDEHELSPEPFTPAAGTLCAEIIATGQPLLLL